MPGIVDQVVAVLRSIYEDRTRHWARYETCEALMDIAGHKVVPKNTADHP